MLVIAVIQLFPKADKKVDGEWEMISKVENADFKEYVGLEIKWKMFITEQDNKVKGSAEKIEINYKPLDYRIRTSMNFDGTIKGNKMILNYTEAGKMRNTTGIIIVKLSNESFKGNFSQTASSTTGEILGKKIN